MIAVESSQGGAALGYVVSAPSVLRSHQPRTEEFLAILNVD